MTNLTTFIEEWKTVSNYPDYEISSAGRVRTKARKIRYTHALTGNEHFRAKESAFLRIYDTAWGYKFVQLRIKKQPKNLTIHRLVALNFLPLEEGKNVVNHKDGNKHNNTLDNLEWCTNAYNHEHAIKTGLIPRGSQVSGSVLNEHSVYAIKKMLTDGLTNVQIAEWFNISRSSISQIKKGLTWKHVSQLTRTR